MPTRSCLALTSLLAMILLLCVSTARAETDLYPLKHAIKPPAIGVQQFPGLGRSVAIAGRYAVIGAPDDDIRGQDSGVVKVFDSETGALLHVLLNPAASAHDKFGVALAISGTRLIVGASQAGESNGGRAYVYDLAGADPTNPVITLISPHGAFSSQLFGCSVGISGTRLVVGAKEAGSGKAYVFDMASETPGTPIADLQKPNPEGGDQFGTSVAIDGTLVVVGAPYHGPSSTEIGAAYIYDLASDTPEAPVRTLAPAGDVTGSRFGTAVAISGSTAVIGAPLDTTGPHVYVFGIDPEAPASLITSFRNPGPVLNSRSFGFALAIFGTRILVGAHEGDVIGFGSAHLYDLTSATPTAPVASIGNPNPTQKDEFGFAVAMDGERFVVGAWRENERGIAYSFRLENSPFPTRLATYDSASPSAGDQFGRAIAIDGSLLVVGAPKAFDDGAYLAFVYDLASPTPAVPITRLRSLNNQEAQLLGRSVAISGTRICVVTSELLPGKGFVGVVLIYDLSGVNPSVPVQALRSPNPHTSENFGTSVAISGPKVVVGAPFNASNGGPGRAYIFDLASQTPAVSTGMLMSPAPTSGDRFGYSVSMDGSRVAIGAPPKNDLETGCAYVFDLAGESPTVPTRTFPGLAGEFGFTTAIDGDFVVVGAKDRALSFNPGQVYVYDLTNNASSEPLLALQSPTPSLSDQFGVTVAISGTRFAVGGGIDGSETSLRGCARIYDLQSGRPAEPIAIVKTPAYSLAFHGNDVVIGDPADDSVVAGKGAVYIFSPAETTTTPPTLTTPRGNAFIRKSLTVEFALPEQALPGSVTLTFTGTTTAVLTLAAPYETAGAHSITFDPSSPTSAPDIISGSVIPDGAYAITLSYRDALGNPIAAATSENVRIDSVDPIFPLTDKVVAQGEDAPGAGTPDGPPANAKFVSFGVPAVDAGGHVVFTAKWTSSEGKGSGLFRDDAFVAKVGGAVPGLQGATFKSFMEPVIDAGHVVFLATAAGVPKAESSILVSDASGTLETLAQTGVSAPGTGEATFKSFKSISVSGDAVGVLAQLTPGTGSTRTTAANDLGLWVKEGANPLVLAFREGQEIAPGKKIKTLVSLAGGNGSPGQGRGWLIDAGDRAQILAHVTLTDKSQAIVAVALDDLANPMILAESGAGSSFASLGLPATNGAAQTVFLGSLVAGNGVTKANSRGVFAGLDGSGTYLPIVRVDGPAEPDVSTFSQLKDPVLADDGGIAFPATVKGRTVKGVGTQTLWWQPPGEEVRLFARGGIPAAEIPGAQWKSFQSLAVAANRGPIFTGTLIPGKGGVTKASANGVWATDFEGNLRLLVQSGVTQIDGKTVKSFTLLNANVGSQGSTRSFNDDAFVVWRATFTDRSEAIIKTEVP